MTVKELLNVDLISSFRLVAGEKGLDNTIKTVNILDYEYDAGADSPEALPANKFERCSIVLSSLLFARTKADCLLPAFQRLHQDGVSAVAVKTVVFSQLPEEVLAYADQVNMPLLLFGSDGGYFEDIIDVILKTIRDYDKFEILEQNVRMLVEQPLSQSNTLSLVERLCPELPTQYRCVCISPKIPLRIEDYYTVYGSLHGDSHDTRTILPYDGDFLLLESAKEQQPLFLPYGTDREHYWIGIGSVHSKREHIRYAIQEACCSVKEAADNKIPAVEFGQMGVRQLTRPLEDAYWLRKFSDSLLLPILRYDEENDTDLFNTLLTYIGQGGDVVETARVMNLHKNSVRYRLDRIRMLTGAENRPDLEFWSGMYLAVQAYYTRET